MQIITGKYRARKLVPVKSEGTRPTLARVKESIFNLIQTEIQDSLVLDLFAGSGAFGVECISRGAKAVYFVDKSGEAIDAIQTNTKNMTEEFHVLKTDFLDALSEFSRKNLAFDIIYLDPPYKSDYAMQAIDKIYRLNLLGHNGLIVVEHESENDLQKLPECYIMEKSRKYGIARVDIFRNKRDK